MKPISYSEMLANFHQSTRHHDPEDLKLYTPICEHVNNRTVKLPYGVGLQSRSGACWWYYLRVGLLMTSPDCRVYLIIVIIIIVITAIEFSLGGSSPYTRNK
jgi:hypothetical protein